MVEDTGEREREGERESEREKARERERRIRIRIFWGLISRNEIFRVLNLGILRFLVLRISCLTTL